MNIFKIQKLFCQHFDKFKDKIVNFILKISTLSRKQTQIQFTFMFITNKFESKENSTEVILVPFAPLSRQRGRCDGQIDFSVHKRILISRTKYNLFSELQRVIKMKNKI